tara:strand:- start:193 stop:402 length:210 start_codon:yes stop_codon:yes gene_type:complete
MISNGVIFIATLGSLGLTIQDPIVGFFVSILFIYPSAIVLAIVTLIGFRKISTKLLKAYFLSISSANSN